MFDGPVLLEISDLYIRGAYLGLMLFNIIVGYKLTKSLLTVYAGGTIVTGLFVYCGLIAPIHFVFWAIIVVVTFLANKIRTTVP